MPTYQYRCAACQHQFDAFQRFAEDPLTECPNCSGAVRRVIQPVGVVFKGSGWYINDSRKKSDSDSSPEPVAKKADKDKAGKSDKSEASAAASTERGSSESKPAPAATESKPAAAAAD